LKKLDLNDSKVVILVEGLTEQILLPCLARACGFDLKAMGAMIIPAGGAKKLARQYLRLKERINLPIFCLFDRDAQSWAAKVSSALRPCDHVHVLADGEIEDLMQLDFFVNQLNNYLTADCLNDSNRLVAASDFSSAQRRTSILDQIWRQRQLGKFEKVKFAQFISSTLCSREAISADGKYMLNKLSMSVGLAAGL
jgi:predicted ATP-dependent endonuclease of OLD family